MIRLTVLEGMPDLLANWSAPRFAKQTDHSAHLAQAFRQNLDLSGFSTTFRSLKCNEDPSHEYNSLLGILDERIYRALPVEDRRQLLPEYLPAQEPGSEQQHHGTQAGTYSKDATRLGNAFTMKSTRALICCSFNGPPSDSA